MLPKKAQHFLDLSGRQNDGAQLCAPLGGDLHDKAARAPVAVDAYNRAVLIGETRGLDSREWLFGLWVVP